MYTLKPLQFVFRMMKKTEATELICEDGFF
jgi:hypothetical protein